MNNMSRFLTKLLVIGLLVCFGVFYGVDLATNGITEINGPIETDAAEAAETVTETSGETAEAAATDAEPANPLRAPVQDPTLVNVLADATGNVLQRTARGGIELIVSLFDGILH